MAIAVAALMTLAVIDNHAGSAPLNASPAPEAAPTPLHNEFDMLPHPDDAKAMQDARKAADDAFRAAWSPRTLPRTSGAAGYITALTDCDDHCQRQQRRLDKQDAKAFDRLLSDKPHDRRRGDRHDRHDRHHDRKGGHQ